RRRHTRFSRDWSSDVCSSDLSLPMDTLKDLAMQTALTPKESPLALRKKGKKVSIGLPKEFSPDENRIVLTPDAAGVLVRNGIDEIGRASCRERVEIVRGARDG